MGLPRDERTKTVAKLIKAKEIYKFSDIFGPEVCFPRTLLANYLGTNNNRMKRIIHNPGRLNVLEIKRIADYFQVPYEAMLLLINRQVFPFVKFQGEN